jgi:methyl-accepting chemotaxis protein
MSAVTKRKLPMWAKAIVVAVLIIAPLVGMLTMLVQNTNYKIDFTRWEMYGTRYLRPASQLQEALTRYQGLLRGTAVPGSDLATARSQAEAEIDARLVALQALDQTLQEALKTTPLELGARGRQAAEPAKIETLWRQLQRERSAGKSSPEADAAMVRSLRAAVRTLIGHVGDSSKLILDPDLDTYYVMDALLLKEPDLIDRIADVSEQAIGLLARRTTITLEERSSLAGKVSLMLAAADGLKVDLETAFQETAHFNDHQGLKVALAPRLRVALTSLERLGGLLQTGLLVIPTPSATVAEIEQAESNAHAANTQLWADLLDHEDIMLGTHLGKDLASRRHVLLSATALLVLMILMLVVFVRNFRTQSRTIAALQESVAMLRQAIGRIDEHSNANGQALTRQAAALQETQTTAQQIKQTSQVAAQSAVGILDLVDRADSLGRSGEGAIEGSLQGLQQIKSHFSELAVKIGELNERTMQIGSITQTVKDLADQSNILALNAAIEAVRSGEHGKGFSVVAREIRNLADQSIQATNRVQELLGSIGSATRQAVAFAETGGHRIEAELGQVRHSGESLRELSKIVQESTSGVRHIAAAVNEQNVGISQIFTAVIDQNRMMDETVKRLDETREATLLVKSASQNLAQVADQLRI